MRPTLVLTIALAVAITGNTPRTRTPLPTPAANVRGGGSLSQELSMVQIEQMRIISPDAASLEKLRRREEELKYALEAGRDIRPGERPYLFLPDSERASLPQRASCFSSTSPHGTPRS